MVDKQTIEIKERNRVRSKLLDSLFGHRNLDVLFDDKLWPDMQNSDELLHPVYQYVLNDYSLRHDVYNRSEFDKWNHRVKLYTNAE